MSPDAAGRRTILAAAAAAGVGAVVQARAATAASEAQPDIAARIQALLPELESRAAQGMQALDLPGLAIGIVTGDRLVYARGFGARGKNGGGAVGTRTVFQIGSATKAFLAATIAIMVDRGKLRWDDRVVDLDPEFQLFDAWVTREFRVFDLLAQRSGLPPYANDALGLLGVDEAGLIRSLRHVEPVSSFRSTFAYTNITHLIAGRIVAKVAGAADWNEVLRTELLEPLGMKQSTCSAAAIEAAPDHALGYRWTPSGTVEVPFTQLFPYNFGGAGNINSTIEDMAQWLRLQLAHGTFAGRRLISPEALAVTHTPKVAMSEAASYAMGWVVKRTPYGSIVWHNGGTSAFGAFVGMAADRDVGVAVLSNETNMGLPDALGAWTLERLLGNPDIDFVPLVLKHATEGFNRTETMFAKPANPRPFPPLAPLAGTFVNPAFGRATVAVQDNALAMRLHATGARLLLEPWDGGVFTARLLPEGRFAAVVADLGPQPSAFVQFQIGNDGRLGLLRLSMDDGQSYVFQKE